MTYVVTENCVKCLFQDCVEVCPVDCFYIGENFMVISPDECIDCGVCVPECPADAIVEDSEPEAEDWIEINDKFSQIWPNIFEKGTPPADGENWKDVPGKKEFLSENPGKA